MPLPTEIPRQGLDTPCGTLYRHVSPAGQIVFLLVAFGASLVMGGIVADFAGGLSSFGEAVLHIPYVAVFIAGYGAWLARVQAIVFESVGRSILAAIWKMATQRRRPDSLAEVLPTQERIVELIVRVQKASSAFAWIGWLVAIPSAFAAMWLGGNVGRLVLAVVVLVTVLAWGHMLAFLGRRGWLPIPEEE